MSEYAETTAKEQTTDQRARELPERIVIPPIKGEMVHLRRATIDDIARMEVIEAYVGASGITGKDRVAERGAVNAWVRRSVAWSNGENRTNPAWGIRNLVVPSHGPSSPKPTMTVTASLTRPLPTT